jgi:hypothetical protein
MLYFNRLMHHWVNYYTVGLLAIMFVQPVNAQSNGQEGMQKPILFPNYPNCSF